MKTVIFLALFSFNAVGHEWYQISQSAACHPVSRKDIMRLTDTCTTIRPWANPDLLFFKCAFGLTFGFAPSEAKCVKMSRLHVNKFPQ
jgi:hypothetical protein